jgi:hypothetical protein
MFFMALYYSSLGGCQRGIMLLWVGIALVPMLCVGSAQPALGVCIRSITAALSQVRIPTQSMGTRERLVQTLGQSSVHSNTDVYLANESPCRTNLLTSRCSDPICQVWIFGDRGNQNRSKAAFTLIPTFLSGNA